MNKKIIVGMAAAALVVLAIFVAIDTTPSKTNNPAFHITLATPTLYKNGIYSEKIVLNEGGHTFNFVPNGDSPKTLGITLQGKTFDFSEDFMLVGTPHQTGISEYYTWDYSGQKTITVPDRQQALIEIDPNGNVMGPVSVYILKD